jgi:hypothetical protein
MERIFILLAATLLAAAPLTAQSNVTVAPSTTTSSFDEERRQVAAGLKEVYGMLDNQLRVVTELIGTVDKIAAKQLEVINAEIAADKARAEAALNSMRDTDATTWPTAKVEYLNLTAELRTTAEARERGLEEAYGNK